MKRMPVTINVYCVLDTFFPLSLSPALLRVYCVLCCVGLLRIFVGERHFDTKTHRRLWSLASHRSLAPMYMPGLPAAEFGCPRQKW